jgi:creatinine amidohydrolase
MRLELMTWRQVEKYLEQQDTLIIPTGSTEQHGPNGLIGTDHLVAEGVARAVGERCGVPVHPTVTVGMSLHHLGFAGTSSLTAATFGRVLTEIVESTARHGFRRFLFINGHGGNNEAGSAAASDLLARRSNIDWIWRAWWDKPEIEALATEFFGDRNGDHATPSEISITMYLYPGLVEGIAACKVTHPEHEWPLCPEAFRATFPDGRMYSDPSLADPEKGRRLFQLSVKLNAAELSKKLGG